MSKYINIFGQGLGILFRSVKLSVLLSPHLNKECVILPTFVKCAGMEKEWDDGILCLTVAVFVFSSAGLIELE